MKPFLSFSHCDFGHVFPCSPLFTLHELPPLPAPSLNEREGPALKVRGVYCSTFQPCYPKKALPTASCRKIRWRQEGRGSRATK